jgi:hypothetical protein
LQVISRILSHAKMRPAIDEAKQKVTPSAVHVRKESDPKPQIAERLEVKAAIAEGRPIKRKRDDELETSLPNKKRVSTKVNHGNAQAVFLSSLSGELDSDGEAPEAPKVTTSA